MPTRRITAAAFMVAFLALGTTANASDAHWFVDLNAWQFDQSGGDDLTGLALDLGYDLNNYFTLQTRAGRTESTDVGANLDYRIDYYLGAYLRFNLRYNHLTVYALGGYSYFKEGGSAVQGAGVKDSEYGGAGGMGLALFGSEDTAITLEYLRHVLADSDQDVNTIHVGLLHHFGLRRPSKRY